MTHGDGGSESFTHEEAVQYLKNKLAQPTQDWIKRERAFGYREGHQNALKQMAQPEQRSNEHLEPVAWLHWLHGPVRLFLNKDEAMLELDRLNREYPVGKDARQMKPLYTTPPQRTAAEGEDTKAWVGLTDAEITRLGDLDVDSNYFGLWYDFAKAIEAKLKEKNT